MKKIDFKALFVPFQGSVAHKAAAVLATLAVTAGLIFGAHLWLHKEKPSADKTPQAPQSSQVESGAEK